MLVHDGNGIGNHLRGGLAVSIFCAASSLVIAQLIKQALAQVAAGDSGRIHLANKFQSLVQIRKIEAGLKCGLR